MKYEDPYGYGSRQAFTLAAATPFTIDVDAKPFNSLFFCVVNGGGNPFTAFVIQARANESSPYIPVQSASGDYTAPAGIMIDASGDLTALAAGASGWFLFRPSGLADVRVIITSTLGATPCNAWWGLNV